MKTISEFQGEYRWLSNFWPCKGLEGPTVEHCYQAKKALYPDSAFLILKAKTPGEAKRLARTFVMKLMSIERRLEIMNDLLKVKFGNKNPLLQAKLLDTNFYWLEEGNKWHDSFWGICHCGKCPGGENNLGKLLMRIRDSLR